MFEVNQSPDLWGGVYPSPYPSPGPENGGANLEKPLVLIRHAFVACHFLQELPCETIKTKNLIVPVRGELAAPVIGF